MVKEIMLKENDFSIRETSYSDIRILLPLYVNFYNELRSKQGWKLASIEEYEDDVKTILKRDKVFIACHKDLAVGFARISRRDGAYWIEELYVEKNYRRLGIGRKLVERAEKYIKEFEISAYILVLPQDKEALEFWVKMGYNMLNSIELVRDFGKTKRSLKPRTVSILGYPLKLARWNHEKYTDKELEYLKIIDDFFKAGGTREIYLKLVIKALSNYNTNKN